MARRSRSPRICGDSAVSAMFGLAAIATSVHGAAPIPAMFGFWTGNSATSQMGPINYQGQAFMSVSTPDKDGSVYIRHEAENQLFRIRGTLVEYCFQYDHPEEPILGADNAPLELVAGGPREVNFCWRGPRLPSHAANCTGCGCAHWQLHIGEDSIHSVFMMSPPVKHLDITLRKMNASVPSPDDLRRGQDCEFLNGTGSHVPLPRAGQSVPPRCPGRSSPGRSSPGLAPPASAPEQLPYARCLLFRQGLEGPLLRYEVPTAPCAPCNVSFQVSAPVPAASGHYLAIGFKDSYAAYYNSTLVPEIPGYFSMQNDRPYSELSGRIIVGYVDSNGGSCVRQMKATAPVALLADVPPDGTVHHAGASVDGSGRRINLGFTALVTLGETVADFDSQMLTALGKLRVMWALGPVEGEGSCRSPLGFHGNSRALASFNFLGYTFPIPCPAEAEPHRPAPDEVMLGTDLAGAPSGMLQV